MTSGTRQGSTIMESHRIERRRLYIPALILLPRTACGNSVKGRSGGRETVLPNGLRQDGGRYYTLVAGSALARALSPVPLVPGCGRSRSLSATLRVQMQTILVRLTPH